MDLPPFKPEGRLDQYPLPFLLAQLLGERRSGLLFLGEEQDNCWIYLEEGFPAGVRAPKLTDYLGGVLRELNLLDDATFNESLMVMAKTRRLQGEILLERGKITEDQLERALSLQLARKLARLFAIKQGPYLFLEDETPPPPFDPIRVNPFALIHNGIRNNYGGEELDKILKVLAHKACRLSDRFDERKELIGWTGEELEDAELLRAYRTVEDFARLARSGPTVAKMILLALLCSGMLELADASRAVAAPPAEESPRPQAARVRQPATRPSPGPAPASSSAPKRADRESGGISPSLRRSIEAMFSRVRTSDYYQLLEIDRTASAAEIKKSVLSLLKVFHPDRLGGNADSDISRKIEFITVQINQAFATLSDRASRERYDAGLDDAPQEGTRRPAEAEIQFQKGLVFLKKRDFSQALESMQLASDLDPKNSDITAHLIWTRLHAEDGMSDKKKIEEAKTKLMALVTKDARCFFALKFLSTLFRKLGDTDNYEKALKIAYKLNSNDVEVTRELRLFRSRKEKEKGKLLGRFRK